MIIYTWYISKGMPGMNLKEYKAKYHAIYQDATRNDVGSSLAVARQNKLLFYRGQCYRHGSVVLYTRDNTCPICQKINRDSRYKKDQSFQRARSLRSELQRRAHRKGIAFNLSTEYLRSLLRDTQVCPVFGVQLEHGRGNLHDFSPSVDRIDPSKGYVVGNVVIISLKANRLKSDGTLLEHVKLIEWLSKYKQLKNLTVLTQRMRNELEEQQRPT